jgi:two-component system sensor histidine kinase SenX3
VAFRKKRTQNSTTPALEPQPKNLEHSELVSLLEIFDAESILLNNLDQITYQSAGINTLALTKDNLIIFEPLLVLVRATRRSGIRQETTLNLPRGPIGSGTHDLVVRTSTLGVTGDVAILIFDDSEMRRLNKTRRDFVANISHELKTPIGALSILSEAVLEANDDPEAIARFATRMKVESKRLTELVQEIINLSRLQDKDPLKSGMEVNLNLAILSAIDRCRTNAEKRKVSIDYESTIPFYTFGDLEQITMAIENLIENAINYSADNTRVGVGIRENQDIIEVTVTDQGIGISAENLDRIFERFYRVDEARSRETGGTGLGLSIVKHVAQNHGGEVTVWSKENSGSTFTLRLPKYEVGVKQI